MCIGVKKGNSRFSDFEHKSFKDYKNKQKTLPTATTMRQEVIHCSEPLDTGKVARPAAWNKGKCVEYLNKH